MADKLKQIKEFEQKADFGDDDLLLIQGQGTTYNVQGRAVKQYSENAAKPQVELAKKEAAAAAEAANRAEKAIQHPAVPDPVTGNWMVWDQASGRYNETMPPVRAEGQDFEIKGYYPTLGDLEAAVPDPDKGYAYGIGTEPPYDIYVWDQVHQVWVNNGPMTASGDMLRSTYDPQQKKQDIFAYTDKALQDALAADVGRSMEGKQVEPTQGTMVTAANWAEIFNDYRERTYGSDEGYETVVPTGGNIAAGRAAHAEGTATTASGNSSHAEGTGTRATGIAAHAEGGRRTGDVGCIASGYGSHAEGSSTKADGTSAHAEGTSTTASGDSSHAEGSLTLASGAQSHAEGILTTASGDSSHAEGTGTRATGSSSHAEGGRFTEDVGCIASGYGSHAEGVSTKADGSGAHAEGRGTEATAAGTHAEGYKSAASKECAHAEGYQTTASGSYSHAEGANTVASGYDAHAEGISTQALSTNAHAGGQGTITEYHSEMAIGRYNVKKNPSSYNTLGDLFAVGKGTSDTARANAFRVSTAGVYGTAAFNASGADYAELFEWADGNPENADRAGRFVTLEGARIRLAGPKDDFILGIVSGSPSVVGDVYDDQWQGMYLTDIFGRPVWEDVEVPDVTEEMPVGDSGEENEGQHLEIQREPRVIIPAHTERRQKLNPDYDSSQPYLPRSERPEWDAVGMLGKLVAVDDGSCQVNGWATVRDGGAATASAERTRYRVMERLDESHVRILIL